MLNAQAAIANWYGRRPSPKYLRCEQGDAGHIKVGTSRCDVRGRRTAASLPFRFVPCPIVGHKIVAKLVEHTLVDFFPRLAH